MSAVYILDLKGKIIISRNYRGDIEKSVIDQLVEKILEKEEEGVLTPLIQFDEASIAYIKHRNLYLAATTKRNSNVMMIFSVLHKICSVSHDEQNCLGTL